MVLPARNVYWLFATCAAVAYLKMRLSPFIGCNSPHNNIFPWHSAVWASFTKTVLVLRWTLPWRLIGTVSQHFKAIPPPKNICNA